MSKVRVWREMVEYLAANRKLLLLPVLLMMALLGGVAMLAQSPSLAPIIYALF